MNQKNHLKAISVSDFIHYFEKIFTDASARENLPGTTFENKNLND